MTDFYLGLATGAIIGFFLTFIYFWVFWMNRNPHRALLSFREQRVVDQWKLEQASALLRGLDNVYLWPKGFERCQVSDEGEHIGAGPYADGRHICYNCGVVGIPINEKVSAGKPE